MALAWIAGVGLCVFAGAIVIYMLFRGIQFLKPGDADDSTPARARAEQGTGGFLDPIIGTVVLTILGTLIATPIGVAIAVWLSEYGASGVACAGGRVLGRDRRRHTDASCWRSSSCSSSARVSSDSCRSPPTGGAVFGRSFFIAATMMSLIALPLVVGSTRRRFRRSPPTSARLFAWAITSTVRRVLLPGRAPVSPPGHARYGTDRRDTAIVVILLGATLTEPARRASRFFGFLRGTGSTLTSYVYNNSPAGEGSAPDKAYAAAFVLLIIVILLNFGVDLIARRRGPNGRSN